jgi:hypothetical protein
VKAATLFLFSILFLTSCSDVKKSSQLASIDDMTQKLKSLKQEVKDNKVDSARSYSIEAREIELRIKNNYFTDTIDLVFGSKMDRHKLMRKAFGTMDSQYSNVISGCDEIIESLRQLRYDIDNGDGDRAKYPEYIEFEKSKFEQLNVLSKEYLEAKKISVATYEELHKEIDDFSWKLLNENKKLK